MPLARIITVEPEAARDLAAHLCLQGFEVEAVRPGTACAYAADREIDLAHCAPEEAAVCIGNILREPIGDGPAADCLKAGTAHQEYYLLSRAEEPPVPELIEGEEELSNWPMWDLLGARRPANSQQAAPAASRKQAAPRVAWSLRKGIRPLLAALGVAAVIMTAFLLHRHTARAEPVAHSIPQAGGQVLTQPALPPVESPPVRARAEKKNPKTSHARAREAHRSHADKLIAKDTVVRFDRRKLLASDRQHRAAHGRSRAAAPNVVAADTVIRHNIP